MSEVRMSIKEYDEMRNELSLYNRALKSMLKPKLDEWDLKWYKENPDSIITCRSKSLNDMDEDVQTLINSIIEDSISGDISAIEGIIEINNFDINLLTITHNSEENPE